MRVFFYSLTYFFLFSTDQSFVPLATINKKPPAKPIFLRNDIFCIGSAKFKWKIKAVDKQNKARRLAAILALYPIIINKGSKEGIIKGMPVLDGKNLIGRIVEVNYLSSRVLLLNDLNSRIPVIIDKSGDQAILSGKGTERPILEYLPELHTPENDLSIFTSGKDGIFYQGVAIGKTRIKDSLIEVKLFSDPNQLSYVSVQLPSLIKKEKEKEN